MSIALGILLAILHFLLSHWMRKRSLFHLDHHFLSVFSLFFGFLFRLLLLGTLLFLLSRIPMIHIQTLLISLVVSYTLLLPLEWIPWRTQKKSSSMQ